MTLTSRIQKALGLERKSGTATPDPWLFDVLGATPSAAGIRVTPQVAMQCAPVRCAVQAISESIGQLPLLTYQRAADGSKERAPDHPAYRLLHDEANPWTPATKFRQEITRDALLYPQGGFADIVRVEGKPVELIRIDQQTFPVTVDWSNREPTYSVQEGNGKRSIDRRDILHISSPSMSGHGLIYDAREAIGLALTLERHAARLFGNGARPSGLLSLKGKLPPDALRRAKAMFQESHGGDKSGSTAVIPEDASWQALTLTSVDSQFNECRTFQLAEIARVFRVPQHMLYEMGRATFANAEEMGQQFLDFTLMYWLAAWEGELRLKIFDGEERANFYAEFLTDNFVRVNYAARMEGLSKAIAARLINPNEGRAILGMPKYSGGDEFINPAIQTANLQ